MILSTEVLRISKEDKIDYFVLRYMYKFIRCNAALRCCAPSAKTSLSSTGIDVEYGIAVGVDGALAG